MKWSIATLANRRTPAWYATLALLSLISACTTPAQRLQRLARTADLHPLQLAGGGFHLAAFRNNASGGILHVYLSGDGTPWLDRFTISPDPTPRQPLALRLMTHDPEPSLYLSRPCYQAHFHDRRCNPLLWTSYRYSPAVVTAMAAALHSYLHHHAFHGLVFIGYSGGGTLAMLLAPLFASTRMVVTIAGNLDPAAWTTRHNYTPLAGSLNPAEQPPLAAHIRQLHLVGSQDRIVPPALIRKAVSRQPCTELEIVPGYNHHCCWLAAWPAILRQVRRMLAAPTCPVRHTTG